MRERYWASKLPNNCFCCWAEWRPGFHLHHRTYKNLGNERLMDLVPVCQDCHDLIHRLYRAEPKWRRIGLWGLTKHVARRKGGERRRKEYLWERGCKRPNWQKRGE